MRIIGNKKDGYRTISSFAKATEVIENSVNEADENSAEVITDAPAVDSLTEADGYEAPEAEENTAPKKGANKKNKAKK